MLQHVYNTRQSGPPGTVFIAVQVAYFGFVSCSCKERLNFAGDNKLVGVDGAD